ncbi:MAG: hypothetical protein WBB67_13850 [bacterium]
MRLHWLIQPDTILTELPYDLDFISKTNIEQFADWCRSATDKEELAIGKYEINRALVNFFVEKVFPKLDAKLQKEKTIFILKQLHSLLEVSIYEPIKLSNSNINKIIEILDKVDGETYFDKTVRKIKVAVALKWLQDEELFKVLSIDTKNFISRCGDFYGRAKTGEHLYMKDIGAYSPSSEDKTKILDDFEIKVELALLEASQELKGIRAKAVTNGDYGSFSRIIESIKRLENFIDGKDDGNYDYIEQFKDAIFVVIILNYIQDPYIKRSLEAKKLLKMMLPIYTTYKKMTE